MIRTVVALMVVGAVAIFVGIVFFYPAEVASPSQDEQTQTLTNQSCKECHPVAWVEWQTSYHSKSFSDVKVQAAFRHFGFDRKCESCHAPEPVFVTGLNEPVKLRAHDRESGVNCLTCHAMPDGKSVAATRTIDAPCRPVATKELATSRSCAVCHDAIFQDWQASRFAKENKSCQSCHMSAKLDQSQSSHRCLGAHDTTFLRSGVKMACETDGDELVVKVTNHATGHNFPGERHNRILLLQVIEKREDGEITLSQQALIKHVTPFRGESTTEHIKAGDTFTATFPIVEPPVSAHVQLLYKMFPYVRDEEAIVVHEERLQLEK